MNSEAKSNMDSKYIVKLTLTLCITCLIVALALGLVDHVTRGPIDMANNAATYEALDLVFSDVSDAEYQEMDVSDAMTSAAAGYSTTLETVYDVLSNGADVGDAVKIVASGSQGNIEMVVGLDADGVVTGVSIVSNSETSGIGSRVMANEALSSGTGVLDQFIGKSAADGTLAIGSNVEAISGATVSSTGVTAGVNGAIAVSGAVD